MFVNRINALCLLAVVMCAALATSAAHAGWVPGAKLTSFPVITLGERFGYANANNGEFLIVGAPDAELEDELGAGAVYIFKRIGDAWTPHQKISPPVGTSGASFAQFGSSVAISRNTLVVGAWGYPGPGANIFAGAAFVFTRNLDTDQWGFQKTLRASDLAAIDQFGWSVSIDMPEIGEGVIAVGKVLDGTENKGAVYVYQGSGADWTQVAKLAPATLAAGDQFGSAVSVRGTTLVGSTQKQNNGGVNAGAAYVFTRTDGVWALATKLLPPDIAAGDAFGASVSLGDGILVVGSPGKRSGSVVGVGRAYIFEGSDATWTSTPIQQRVPFQNDAYGYSVAVQRPEEPLPAAVVVVSAPGYDSGVANNGAAFAYTKIADVWTLDTTDLFVAGSVSNGALGRSVSLSPDGMRAALSSESPGGTSGAAYGMTNLVKGGGESPGSGGTPGGGNGGAIPGGGVPPTAADPGAGGGIGGGGLGTPGNPTQLSPLAAEFGTVIGTFIMVDPITRTVYAMQSDGLLVNTKPKVEIITQFPENFTLLATPDLNGDSSGDLLFQDRSTGTLHGWLRNGLIITIKNEIEEMPDGFDFASFGDFNGDAIDDLVLRNPSNGNLAVWLMNNQGLLFREVMVDLFDNNWTPEQVDITGDGRPEFMLRQPVSGELLQLQFNISGATQTLVRWPDAASDYDLVAGGDIDGDGTPDLVWDNRSQNQFEVWFMNGDRTERARMRLILESNKWRIERIRDFDGNSRADFLLSRNGTGRLVAVYMDFDEVFGPKIIGSKGFGKIDGSLEIVDFAAR